MPAGDRTSGGSSENRGSPRVAVVSGTPRLISLAREFGAEVVLVRSRDNPDPRTRGMAHHEVAADITSPRAVSAALAPLHSARPFAAVLSLTESGVLSAAVVASELGLPGPSARAAITLQDKRLMRETLRQAGLSPVHFAPVSCVDDLTAFLSRTPGGAVLKPAEGTASKGVFLLDEPQDAPRVWERFAATGETNPIVEERLSGREISVEAFSHRGRHTVVAHTDKLVSPGLVEIGHTVPAGLGARQRADTAALVQRFLDVVGMVDGPSHTEVFLTPHGPRIVESHARIGGDRIRELIERAHGVDLVRTTVACALGAESPPWGPHGAGPPPRRAAAVRFVTPSPGWVSRTRVPTREQLAEAGDGFARLDVAPGDWVPDVRESGDRAGLVLAEGHDPAQAVARCAYLLRCTEVRTEQRPPPGVSPAPCGLPTPAQPRDRERSGRQVKNPPSADRDHKP